MVQSLSQQVQGLVENQPKQGYNFIIPMVLVPYEVKIQNQRGHPHKGLNHQDLGGRMAIGLPRWQLSEQTEHKIRIVTLMLTAVIITYEKFYGDSSTQYPAMYLAVFIWPAVYFTNHIQRKYFTYVMEYAQAIRLASVMMSVAFLGIWCITTFNRINTVISHSLNYPQ
jgi:hypothetical protein